MRIFLILALFVGVYGIYFASLFDVVSHSRSALAVVAGVVAGCTAFGAVWTWNWYSAPERLTSPNGGARQGRLARGALGWVRLVGLFAPIVTWLALLAILLISAGPILAALVEHSRPVLRSEKAARAEVNAQLDRTAALEARVSDPSSKGQKRR